MSVDSVSVWDEEAALQSCWLDCEASPTSAYRYPSDDNDFLYLSGYTDEATRSEWYENVLFFSCLSGCRGQLRSQRWFYIIVPSLCACLAFLVLVCCLVCRSCPLARWCRGGRGKSAVAPHTTPVPHPFLVSTAAQPPGTLPGRGYRRRHSTLDRKLESLYPSLPAAPAPAEYNRLEPGLSLTYSGLVSGPGHGGNSFDAIKKKMSGRKESSSSNKVKVAT